MAINVFVLKGELNGENRSGVFLFLSGIYSKILFILMSKVSQRDDSNE